MLLPAGMLTSLANNWFTDMSNLTPTQPFDIHNKLKANSSHWDYLHAAEPWQGDCAFQLMTDHSNDELEYALYRRIEGDYFCLIDFFKSYSEACDEAKEIINSVPYYKAIIIS